MQQVKKAVFPVAGLGTRFLPATKASPKEMLPIVDKPLIQYAVEESMDAGITDIIFISSRTKDKLKVLRSAKSMVLSRVGDAGISVPHCQVTVDHSGLFGSRIQSLQRLGRLMHSQRALYHCILMTHEERYERFAARVEAIKAKGFPVEEVRAQRQSASVHRLISPTLQARVSAQENQFLSLLGWRRDELNQAA